MNVTDSTVNLIATGDIMLGGNLGKTIKEKGFVSLLSPLKGYFQGADIVFGNLEAPLSDKGIPQRNKTLLYQDKEVIEGLKYLGYNILSLGNNHIMDYEEEGLKETITALQNQGIKYAGAGKNAEEARKPAEFYIKGAKVIFLGYTSPTTDKSNPLIYARESKSGLIPFNLKIIKEDITAARSLGADFVVISLHWGEDRYHFPSPKQIDEARSIIDMGADIILGHHSHILQGIERYKKGIIVYSLGNFLFGEFLLPNGRIQRWGLRNRLTVYVKFKIEKGNTINYEVVSLWIGEDLIPRNLEGEKKRKALSNIQLYSGPLEIKNYEKLWKRTVLKEEINIMLEKIRLKLSKYAV